MRFQEWMAKKNELIQLTLKKKEFKRGNRLEVILKSEMNSIHWIVQKFKKIPKKSEIRFSINILFGGRGGREAWECFEHTEIEWLYSKETNLVERREKSGIQIQKFKCWKMRENSKIQKLNFKIFKQLKSGGGVTHADCGIVTFEVNWFILNEKKLIFLVRADNVAKIMKIWPKTNMKTFVLEV